ncbi:MAG TPA: Re/Si-specific NAD(P)(+) transhydrogenase subunit alpha [Gammaproteobacteria bacterium]|nr:Re/Si-specific NAD(P)(+) transhydrogenase subunit alpha [Gammaproteobacteria bacterium]
MKLGIIKETQAGETRVAATPDTVKKICGKGLVVLIEKGAGSGSRYADTAYQEAGAELVDQNTALAADIVFKVAYPNTDELAQMSAGSLLVSHIDVCGENNPKLKALADSKVDAIAMQLIPRISRAQNMDALSSQAGIAGYRAVIEAASLFGRFLPLMMTAAGSAKPAKVTVLGAGVAGLQAIATARRLGANVFGYDVRPQVKGEIQSLGAKFIELDVGESGEGEGGYARELSDEAKKRQTELLTQELMTADIIISTALIPCRQAPVLITEDAVKGMRPGSVIIDMAAANGGNCPLSKPNKTLTKHGIKICGNTNFPAMMAADASNFYARNLLNLLPLLVEGKAEEMHRKDLLEDEITEKSTVTFNGEVRFTR